MAAAWGNEEECYDHEGDLEYKAINSTFSLLGR